MGTTKSSLSSSPEVPRSSTGITNSTRLCKASLKGQTEAVRILLAHKASPNVQNCDGWSPLHEAAFYGFEEIARLLLSAGADPNLNDSLSYSPLNRACSKLSLGVARLLLDHDSKIDNPNHDGWTPLSESAYNGNGECELCG